MNNLVILDLDGVLANLKDVHFDALNAALVEHHFAPISREDHLSKFDGLPTTVKLRNLGICGALAQDIDRRKQEITTRVLPDHVHKSPEMASMFHEVIAAGWLIGVCSNARADTVATCLELLGVDPLVCWQYTPDSTKMRPKPSPEMMLNMMLRADACPKSTVIFEDSPRGLEAAHATGARVVQVDYTPITSRFVMDRLSTKRSPTFKWGNLNVVVPAAGDGSRFARAGYDVPKPFITLPNGRSMLEFVVDNLGVVANYRYLIRAEHMLHREAQCAVRSLGNDCVRYVERPTRGTAETCLLLASEVDSDAPLLVANADQLLDWDRLGFYYFCRNTNLDGVVVTFDCPERDPKWSFVEVGKDGLVSGVVEKEPVSNTACVGVWFFKHGRDFVRYAKRMVDGGDTTKGEFYVSGVYNLAIADGKRFGTFKVDRMTGLGVPEDLERYVRDQRGVRR